MNERDYNLIEYCSIVAGLCLIGEGLMIFLAFDIPLTPVNMIFQLITGIVTIFIATIAHFKKILYIQEMKSYIKRGRKNEKMDSDTAP